MTVSAVKPSIFNFIRAARVVHWTKNLLLFAPLLLAHKIGASELWIRSLAAFISFSLLASAVYIINDIADIENDQNHRLKKFRPVTSGEMSIFSAVLFSAVMIFASALIGFLIGPLFSLTLASYMALTLAYTFFVKRILVLDVFVLASLYCIRIIAGQVATGVEFSPWLLGFAFLNFSGLALLKRFIEISETCGKDDSQIAGRAYCYGHLSFVRLAGYFFGLASVVLFSVYLNSEHARQLYADTTLLWLVAPALLFWKIRIWVKAEHRKVNEDPILFSVRDPFSYLVLVLSVFLVWKAT